MNQKTDEKIRALYEQLKTQRDELRVQMHLGAAELKEEWEAAEKQWQHVEQKLEKAGEEAGEAAHEARETLGVIGEELSTAYRRIRERLKD